jgi:diguanylate cyclase (GGDEF)-like protein/PAS domain S-box-containing protein
MNAELAELQALQLASNTRLLVIDDEPLILSSLEALLKHKHYQVDTALGGKLACQQLEQNHYDLVLLDLNMADVDGFAVMAFMADQGIDAAIVVVSGESTFDAVRKALRMGASDYVKKPYSPEELFATIDSTFHKINLRIDALSAIVNDSSEGVSAREERLIKSNVLFSKAEQIGKLGHWEWDEIAGQYITCSEQYAKILDMTVAQLIGELKNNKKDRELVCEGDRERYNWVVDSAVESKQGWDVKYSSYTKAGRRIYLHEIGNPVLDEHDVLVKTIGTIQDITEISRLEEELKQSNALFHQAEAMGNMGHFFWDLTEDNLISCSGQFARIYGKTVPEALACFTSTEAVLNFMHPDDKERFKQSSYFYNALAKGFDGEYRIITASGDTRHLYERSERVFDKDGEPSLSFGTIQDVTESKRVEEELRQSHALYHQAESMGNMGHFFWDLTEDKLISCSDQFARIYGKTVPEALECFVNIDAVIDLIHPDDKERFRQGTSFHNELHNGNDIEYRVTLSGNTRHLYVRREILLDNDGIPSQSFGIVQDITESKQIKELLQQSNERFEISQKFANAGSWEWDIKSGDLYWSRMISKMFGSLEEALSTSNENFISAIHPDDRQSVQDAINSCIKDDKDYNLQYRVVWPDGTIRWLSDQGNVVRNNLGEAERMFGVVQDVTARKKAELALTSSEHRLRLALAVTKQGWFDFNIQTGQMVHSPEYPKLLGYDPADFSSNFDQWQDILHPEDRDAVMADYRRTLSQGCEFSMEYRRKTKNSGWLWIKATAEIVEWTPSQRPLRMIGIHTDINERKQAEMKLERAASVFTHAGEGITITDAAGTIIEVNDTFSHITGYTREEVLGKNSRILNSGHQSPEFYVEMWGALLEQGHWKGEVWNRHKSGEVHAVLLTISAVQNAVGQVQNYVGLFSDITELKDHQNQLVHIANHDILTNLPNRALLSDRLSQAMVQCQRRNQSLAVAFLDLDHFKEVNDTHGHDIGDELLVQVSQRMKEALREGDTLARIGGDEFIAVMADLEKVEDSEPLLKRLLKAAADPVTVGDAVMQVSASIGVTHYPQDGADADQLMRHADQAMYAAKQAGKNCYLVFDAAYDDASKVQRESIDNIRSALDRREFVLHYQPKVNMYTSEVIGIEALIRWQHPDRGLVPPLDFLPTIEAHSISLELGEWVIDTALNQMSQWQSIGINLPISVNMSAYQLQQDNFTTRLTGLLAAHPEVDPHYLELEILETSELSDISQVSTTMNDCHELGVRFALDDFGTGYSSLTYLKRLPAHIIKIDQTFVRDMLSDADDLAIVEGVIGLAKAFKREVIAEGVETIEHGTELLKLGCELAQGYSIARPMPADDIPEWVSNWKADDSWQVKSLID